MRPASLLAAFAFAAAASFAAGPASADVPGPSTAPVPAGAYVVDKAHTSLFFRVNHLGFSTWTGRFTRLDAQLSFNPAKIETSRVNVTIDPASIEADNVPSGFLQTLTGKDWLDASEFGAMSFRSTAVELTGQQTLRVHGDLTLRGVTRPMVLDARYNGGYAGNPYDPNARIGFSAHGSLKRSDFGVSAGIPAPGTTFGVGDNVEVILESEFTGPALKKE